ncbi:uncharacterized protein LOC112012883 [Quercus suber]|uniref:uncharacterized protein LOC112012883 n=1 Tax=Quercus suber TaxID=58331 RepID=UPI000CE1BF5F|nr:uncharacterized protein LOC112012883 [Quercus suber]
MWLSDSRCGEIVEVVWNSCATWDTVGSIISREDRCGKYLEWWNKNVFGNVKRELEKKKKALLKAEREALHNGLNFQVRELQLEINILLDREARMWNQGACILWLSNGDNNTIYFHSKATHRFRKNSIIGLFDASNRWVDQSKTIATVLEDFYKQLFSTSCPSSMASV